jgi:hypothetical protein
VGGGARDSGFETVDAGTHPDRALSYVLIDESSTAPSVIPLDDTPAHFQTHGQLPDGFGWQHVLRMSRPKELLVLLTLSDMVREWNVQWADLTTVGVSPSEARYAWGAELEDPAVRHALGLPPLHPQIPPRSYAPRSHQPYAPLPPPQALAEAEVSQYAHMQRYRTEVPSRTNPQRGEEFVRRRVGGELTL